MSARDEARAALAARDAAAQGQPGVRLEHMDRITAALRSLLDETYECPACGKNCLGFDPQAGAVPASVPVPADESMTFTKHQFPVPADEREALAVILHDLTCGCEQAPTTVDFERADALLAAGFRRQWPITDAQVDAAKVAINEAGAVLYHETIRAALEAARDAS